MNAHPSSSPFLTDHYFSTLPCLHIALSSPCPCPFTCVPACEEASITTTFRLGSNLCIAQHIHSPTLDFYVKWLKSIHVRLEYGLFVSVLVIEKSKTLTLIIILWPLLHYSRFEAVKLPKNRPDILETTLKPDVAGCHVITTFTFNRI